MAVGVLKLSTADIRAVNKGIGVENMHHLNDGLWKVCGVPSGQGYSMGIFNRKQAREVI